MKKNYLFAVAFVAAALTGCSQEELVDFNSKAKSDFTATMETVESRTVLDENNKVQWVVNDDHVSLFEKVDINAKYQVSSVDDNGTAKLAYVTHIEKTDYQTLGKYYAVYPYSDANTIGTDGTITASVSATYTYKDKESCIASALMVARSESKSLRFTNAQGIIRLIINAQTPYTWGKIQSITFTSKANYLSGTAIMSWNGTETPVAVIDTEASDKGQSLTINLDESLKQDLPSKQSGDYAEFYVPVVPTTFAEGDLTMVVKFADEKIYKLEDIKQEITIARKEIITLRHTIGLDDYFSADIEDEVVSDEISNEAQLIKALQTGGKYTLMDEVTLTETVKIPEGIEVTLDLNKQALTGNILAPNATLTVENGTLKNSNPNVSAIEINEGELNLNDVTIESARHAVRIDGDVTATINGGTYKVVTTGSGTYHAVNVSGSANVTIKDGTFIGPKGTTADSGAAVKVQVGATVTIEDGNFSKGKNNTLSSDGTLTVSGGTFDQNPSAFVAEGFAATKNNDGTYSVVKGITAQNAAEFIQAINDVEDGDVIALSGDVNFTTENRIENNGWYEGIYYKGDKSFTLDLGGKTIKNESGAVNDYMLLFKNEGSKANTITIKNGKIDAGTTAFCAIATSTTNNHPITIDLENVELINSNSNGATAKIRGNAILNVKAGTKITGKDSYSCMEIAASTANIYEGAELYQNGTSSYVGSLIGVSGGGTINIYGGKGVSKKCGIAVYSTGGTINAKGGDWTANTDGTVPTPQGDNNLNVLLVQNNTYEQYWSTSSIMNVSGGTYRGGISSAAYTETSKAELNITGGNFNCDPSAFCKEGHEATESNGIWTVK